MQTEYPRLTTHAGDRLTLEVLCDDIDHAEVYVEGKLRWTWARKGTGRFAVFFDLVAAPGLPLHLDGSTDRLLAADAVNAARPDIGSPACPFAESRARQDTRLWGGPVLGRKSVVAGTFE